MKTLLLLLIVSTLVLADKNGQVYDEESGESSLKTERVKSELEELVRTVAKDKFGLNNNAEKTLQDKLYKQFNLVYPELVYLKKNTTDRDIKRTLTALLKDARDIDFKDLMIKTRDLLKTKPEWKSALSLAQQIEQTQKSLLASQYTTFSVDQMESYLKNAGHSVLDLEKFSGGRWSFKTSDPTGKVMLVTLDPNRETRVSPKNPLRVALSECLAPLQQLRYKVESNPVLSVPVTLHWKSNEPERSAGFMGKDKSYSVTSEEALWLKEVFRSDAQKEAINKAKKDLTDEWTRSQVLYRDYALEIE